MRTNISLSCIFIHFLLVGVLICMPSASLAVTLLGGDGVLYRKANASIGYGKSSTLLDQKNESDMSIAWGTYDYESKKIFGKLTPSQGSIPQAFSASLRKKGINIYRDAQAIVVPANPRLPVVLIETNPPIQTNDQLEQGAFDTFRYELLSRSSLSLQPKSAWQNGSDTRNVPGCASATTDEYAWARRFSLTVADISSFDLVAITGFKQEKLSNFTAPQCWSDGTFLLYSRIYKQQAITNSYQIIRSGSKNKGLTTTVLIDNTDGLNCFPVSTARRYAMCTEYYARSKSEGLIIVDFEKKTVSPVKGMEKFYPTSVILVGFSPDSSRAYFYKYKSPRNGLPQFITVNISETPVATIENLPESLRVVSAFDE